MHNSTKKELKRLALVFRSAIELCKHETGVTTLYNFPSGSCGEASLLLAKYFEENGHNGFYYISGERDGKSHTWLIKGGICADITADQFDDNNETVIIRSNSSWHNSFCGEIEHIADFNSYDRKNRELLQYAYNVIKKNIIHTT